MTVTVCLVFKFIRGFITPALIGLLLFVSFRYNYWLLAVLAVALFYHRLIDNPFKVRVRVTFAFAVGFFISHLWWVSVLGVDAVFLLAALCVTSFMLLALIPIGSGSFASKLEFAAAWALVEAYRAHYPWGGFSWGLLGYSQTSGPLVQYARIGNFVLVAFVVVLVATLISDLKLTRHIRAHCLALALVATGYLFPTTGQSGAVQIGVVQGGVVSEQVPEFARASQVLAHHLQQTALHASELREADMVLWPENAVNLQSEPIGIKAQIQAAVDSIGKPFLIGAVRDGVDGHPENVVTLWLPKSGEKTSYVKNHLVPFGEYIPLRNLLASHFGRLNQIPSDFAHGKGGGVIGVASVKVGVAICFEVSDQTHLTNLVNDGATLIFAASNNATYLGTSEPIQQFEISRFAAIAHERTMVVATTTGVSGVISADGVVTNHVLDDGADVFVAKVGLIQNRSFADKHPLAKYLFVAGLILVLVSRRIRNRVTKSTEARAA